jgi:hypothetical protein
MMQRSAVRLTSIRRSAVPTWGGWGNITLLDAVQPTLRKRREISKKKLAETH